MPRSGRSRLPHFLAAGYALMIVYASLEPFSGWLAPAPGTPFFLFAGWPSRFTRFDVAVNVIAYAPLGFFVGLAGARMRPIHDFTRALLAGLTMSLAMESAQMYLPARDASILDFVCNAAGSAAGGALALAFNGAPGVRRAIASWRRRTFIGERIGDLGLTLVGLWLLAQVNPGIPLFAATYDPTPKVSTDLVAILLEAAQVAFGVIGISLFLALLLKHRRYIGGAVMVLIGTSLILKGIAAGMLLRPEMWDHWLRPGVSFGVALGALGLLITVWLPRPAQMAIAGVCLLSSLLAPLFLPDVMHAKAPLSLFDWSYGQLLNFNGLTHALLLIWPIVASIYLLVLAGRPDWGLATEETRVERV